MTNKLEQFLEKQINHGNIDWESKSKLIRASGEKVNGNTTKIVKKFKSKKLSNKFESNKIFGQKNFGSKKNLSTNCFGQKKIWSIFFGGWGGKYERSTCRVRSSQKCDER